MEPPRNLRQEDRRKLHCMAVVRFKDLPSTSGRTIDLSTRGISILLPERIDSGVDALIALDATIQGQHHSFVVRARSVYAILSGTAFRTGFQFTQVPPATAEAILSLYQQLFV